MGLIFLKGNIYTKIDKKRVTGEEVKSLHEILSVKVPGYYFSKKYKMGLWNGYKHFFNRLTGSFYSGLLNYVILKLNCDYSVIDERSPVPNKNNPLFLNGIELREYQKKAVEKAIKIERGIIAMPPNAGKTLISAAITQILGLPTVFLTHRITLLEQTKKRFEQYLGVEVGIFGAKQRSFKEINIMSIASVYKALENKDDEIKEILNKALVVIVDECHHLSAKTFENTMRVCKNAFFRYGLCVSQGSGILLPSGRERKIGALWLAGLKEFDVLSFNHATNKIEPKKARISRIPWDNDTLIIKIKSEDGFTVRLECSSEHNIYSNGEYKEAKDLEIGDNVLMAEMQKNYCLICGKEIPLYRRLCSKKCLIRNWILEGAKGQSKRLQKMTKEERIEAINWKIGLEKAINWAKSEDGKKHNSEYIKNRFKTDPKFAKAVSDGAKKFWKSINEKGLGLKGCRNRWKKYPTKVERLNHLKEIGCYQGFEKHQFKKGHISPHPPIINGKYYNNKVSLGRDGHKLASIVEKKVDDWLFDNRLEHKIHPSIRGTGKYADFLVNDWYIEADGLHRGLDYFNKKYEGKKNWIVVDDFSYSSIGEKLSFLLVSDPVGKVVSIRKVKFNGKFLYDLSVDGNNNFFANGVLVHNSATALLRSEVDNMLVRGLTGEEIAGVTTEELINLGISARPSVYLFDMNRFGNPILPKRHTFDVAYDTGIVNNPQRNTLIVDATKHFLGIGKSVFIIVNRIEHGRILSEIFLRAGLEVPFISGEENPIIIRSRLEEFEKRTLKCLVSSSISDEGIDIPSMDVLIIGVGNRSVLKTIQRVGRGLRRKEVGENVVSIIDFIDSASPYLYRHSVERSKVYVDMGLKIYEVMDRDWNEIIKR